MMATEQMTLLPSSLTAKFRYLCASKTIHGSQQAKCYYICDEKEYSGILFAPDGEEWFDQLTEGALIKACRVSPCGDEKYPGEYKGTALPLDEQPPDIMCTPVNTKAILVDMTNYPALLREAASMIEMLLALTNQTPASQPQEQVKKKLRYRSTSQWADEIVKIIGANNTFQVKPFSALSFNSYMDHCFSDFWEGDLELIKSGPRWRQQVSSALRKLVECNFIEHYPGVQKHYRVTEDTRNQLWDPFDD